MSGEADIPPAARLDALLRLQLEEQNQSRHHEILRDRAIGNMILVNAAMLAILGAMFQAKLDDAPAILSVSKYLIPLVVMAFGRYAYLASRRHSLQAARHWELARLYREQALLLLDGKPGGEIAAKRDLAAKLFDSRNGFIDSRDGKDADETRRIWLRLPVAVIVAGLIMALAAAYSDFIAAPPTRPETNVRIMLDADGEVRISPTIVERWFDLHRRLSTPPDPAPQRTD